MNLIDLLIGAFLGGSFVMFYYEFWFAPYEDDPAPPKSLWKDYLRYFAEKHKN